MQSSKIFYVYAHRKADSGDIFYIGKGKHGRAFSDKGRSFDWESTVNAHGLKVTIIASGLSEYCAYSIEKIAISMHDFGRLCNKTTGGGGIGGFKRSEEFNFSRTGKLNARYDHTIYNFEHATHGKISCTRYELRKKFGLKSEAIGSVIKGQRTHTAGWHMEGTKPNFQKGLDHPAVDKTVYKFIHKDGRVRECTRHEMCREFGMSPSNLKGHVDGMYNSCKGWIVQ